MNSSGIKRGLAATAVAALAVTGLPFLASSASAAASTVTDIDVAYVGPARDGGDVGAAVLIKVKGLGLEGKTYAADSAAINAQMANLRLSSADSTKAASDGTTQVVSIVGTPTWEEDSTSNRLGKDGYDEVLAFIKIDAAGASGGAFKFNAFWDNDGLYDDKGNADPTDDAPGVGLNDPRDLIEGTTVGAPDSLEISPATQTAPENIASGNYTVTVKDSAGRVTQLNNAEDVHVTSNDAADVTMTFTDNEAAPPAPVTGTAIDLNAHTIATGTATFTATGDTKDLYTLTADTTGTAKDITPVTAKLDVIGAATGIINDEVDIVTGADSWDGPGDQALGSTVFVRSDQSSITVKIASPDNAGQVVALNLDGAASGIKFGGKTTGSVTTTLNSAGEGTLTITPDAGTITNSGTIAVTGSIAFSVDFDAPSFDMTRVKTDAGTYLSSYGGSVNVTVTVLDQFDLPMSGQWLAVRRINGANGGATGESYSEKKATNADGQVTFTLTDTKATAASHVKDDLQVARFANQFDASPAVGGGPTDKADIVYTANGEGGDFVIRADGTNTGATAYDPTLNPAVPVTDGVADDGYDLNHDGDSGDAGEFALNEIMAITADGGTPGAPMTVTVNNGGLLLKGGATVANGVTSVNSTVGSTVQMIGTKAGLVDVTVTSGGVTKTAQVLVKAQTNNAATARNLEVTAPEKAVGGDIITFGVKVTDAFGNPVAGYSANDLNLQVSGPGRLQDTDAVSGADGVLKVNVRADDDADSAITLQARATSTGNQFGAAANRLFASDKTNTAPGLTASTQTATGSVTDVIDLQGLQEAVDQAQAKVDAAQDAVDAAKGDLMVAKAERSVAQKAVKSAKKDLRQAKKHHKGVKAARKALREARGDARVARAKVSVAQAKANRANEDLAAAQAELAAAQQALEDAQK